MADLRKTIEILFAGDDQLSGAAGSASSALSSMEDTMRSVTSAVATASEKVLKLNAAMGTFATGGLALILQQSGQWVDSFNEIATLIDDTDEAIERFRAQVLDYGADSSFALDEVNSALYSAISAGIDYEESLDFMDQTQQLAIAGQAELGDTTKALASVMNAYAADIDEVTDYSDIFFTAVKEGQTTVDELATGLSRVTGIAAGAGVEFDEVAAATATLTARGMDTNEAIRALRDMIASIIDPTSEAAELAEKLGIEFNASALESEGLVGVLTEVWDATDGNIEVMSDLFTNVQGLTGVMQAFGPDGGDMFLEKMQEMENRAGSTEEAYEKMKDNLDVAMGELISTMQATLISAGLPLLEEFVEGVQDVPDVFDGLRDSIDEGAFDDLYDAIGAAMDQLFAFISDVGEALPEAVEGIDWTPLIEGAESVAEALGLAFGAMFDELDPREAEDLQEIIQTLVDLAGNFAEVGAGIIQAWSPVFDLLGDLAQGFSNVESETAKTSGELIGATHVWETLMKHLGTGKGTLAALVIQLMAGEEYTGKFAEALKTAVNWAFPWIDSLNQLINAVRGTRDEVDGTTDSVDDAGSSFGIVLDTIESMPGPLGVLASGIRSLGGEAEAAELDLRKVGEGLEEIPEEKYISLSHDEIDFTSIGEGLEELPTEKVIEVDLQALAAEQTLQDLTEYFGLITDQEFTVEAAVDQARSDIADLGIDVEQLTEEQMVELAIALEEEDWANVQRILDDLEEDGGEIPVELDDLTEMEMAEIEGGLEHLQEMARIEADIDITRIEEQAETVREMVKWDAELQIAQVQAQAQRVEATMDSLSTTIQSTGEVITELWGILAGEDLRRGERRDLRSMIQDEMDMRQEAHEMQMDMAEEELRMMEARRKQMEDGEAMIRIDGEGLQPHLEAFMWEILNEIQVRVNEEGMDMLTGV